MKKNVIVTFLLIYFILIASFAYASWVSLAVKRLAPAAAAAAGGGTIKIPAFVKGVTNTGTTAGKWISLALPAVASGSIIGAVLGVAGSLAMDYLMNNSPEWFQEKNLESENGRTVNPQTVTLPSTNPNPSDYTNNPSAQGVYSTSNAAALACQNHRIFGGIACSSSTTCQQDIGTGDRPNGVSKDYINAFRWVCTHSGVSTPYYFYYEKADVDQTPPLMVKNPVPPAKVADDVKNDMQNLNKLSALNVAIVALQAVADALNNPGHDLNKDIVAKATIANALNGAITQSQKDALEPTAVPMDDTTAIEQAKEQATPLTPAEIAAAVTAALKGQGLSADQIAATIAAAQQGATGGLTQAQLEATLQSQGLSAAQIAAAITAAGGTVTKTDVKEAVKEAIDDETGVTVPVDPTISLPAKLNLTTVLNDFWTSVQALPIFNVLNGITITTSGSSSLCIDLPAAYGGQRCYNAANIQDELNMIGSVILGLTTVISFIGIFKG